MSAATSSGVPSDSTSRIACGVERIAGVHELLDRARRRLVHHLEPGRDDAGADDGGHRVAGLAPTSSNAASATCATCGFGVSFTVISVMTASRPSEPVIEREQIVARRCRAHRRRTRRPRR